jgi:hypothetical protein
MKYIKLFKNILLLVVAASFVSCSRDNDDEKILPVNELEGLQMVSTISNDQHKIELYTANGKFQTGYNVVYFQVKNLDGTLINDITATWTPTMKMTSMSHSCPSSSITKKENTLSVYMGYIVFQMAGNEVEYWELALDYLVHGTSYTVNGKIEVSAAAKRVVESIKGTDDKRYILALVGPVDPIVGINDMKAVLYRMETMMDFIPVEGYNVKIDPRMPGMGNHSSPNNVDLSQNTDRMYHGKLSLTMTGYWKINLQLLDASGTVLKGEKVTDSNESSSIYFEVEF